MSSITYTAKKGLKHIGSEVGSWLADTTAESVVGADLVTNGDFPTATTGWTGANSATLSINTARLEVTNGAADYGYTYQAITCVVGKTYVLSHDKTTGVGGASSTFGVGTTHGSVDILAATSAEYASFTATATTVYIWFQINSNTLSDSFIIDDVSVRLADNDLSTNDHDLAYYGTITKAAVATGSTVMGYSGFSVANYLRQLYDPTLDITDDVTLIAWVNFSEVSSTQAIIGNFENVAGDTGGWMLSSIAGVLRIQTFAGDVAENSSASDVSTWTMVIGTIDSSGNIKLYIDGALVDSDTGAAIDATATPVSVGVRNNTPLNPFTGSIALARVLNTALTAVQIKSIYDSEKHLFKVNSFFTQIGEEYSMDVDLSSATYSNKEISTVSKSIGGNQETVHQRTEVMHDIAIDGVHKSELGEIRAFLQSVNAGETFELDVYGTVASPEDPVNVIANPGFKEGRINNSNYFNIPMKLREV